MAAVMHHDTPDAPALPVRGPRAEVERVDALSCDAPAISRIGDHCVCVNHEVEVRLAYWGTDANLRVSVIAANEYFQCGDVYSAPEVSRGA